MALAGDALICVDFDDTLVTNQEHFAQAERQLADLLRDTCGADTTAALHAFRRIDARHQHLGRHRNRFLVTVLAAYCAVRGSDAVPLELLPRLAAIAAHPYDARPEPKPGAVHALERLRAAHPGPLWLVTAGDRVIQTGRVHHSGLASFFDAVHVVPEKTEAVFTELGRGYARRVMIGNSPRSDILPALAAGFDALYVRVPTWLLDLAPLPAAVSEFESFAAAVDGVLGL